MALERKLGRYSKAPFVCQKNPFVCHYPDSDSPSVRHLIPSVVFDNFSRPITGFSLIELVITLAVVGILLGIGTPAIGRFVESTRLTSATNNLISDLSLARTEAVKRGVRVGLCTSADQSTCTNSGTWTQGWLVFVDQDGSSAWTAGTDQVLRARESLAGSMSAGSALSTGGAINLSLYDRRGAVPVLTATNTNDEIEYTLCNAKLGKGRKVKVNEFGRHTLENIAC